MNYSEQLQQDEWLVKAAKIIERDSFKCQKCGNLGYHGTSFKKFYDLNQIDEVFNGWRINNVPVSSFIGAELHNETEYKDSSNWVIEEFYKSENDVSFRNNGYVLYSLRSDLPECSNIIFNSYLYVKHNIEGLLENKTIHRRIFFQDSGKIQLSSPDNNFVFIRGIAYRFETNINDEGIVSINHIFPTDIISDGYRPIMLGCVVVNISYQNLILSLYLEENIEGLNVHHKLYVRGKKPWEYSEDHLITLCESCHKETHLKEEIPIYRSINSSLIKESETCPCTRCYGAGYIHQYKHIQNGICFECWGEGVNLKDLDS